MTDEDVGLLKDSFMKLLTLGKEKQELLFKKLNKPLREGPRFKKPFMFIDGFWMPSEIGTAKIQTDPDLFVYSNIDNYWKLFKRIIPILENPIVQFTIRPMQEIVYSRLIAYRSVDFSEQKRIATKYWLCLLGQIYPSSPYEDSGLNRDKMYRAFLELLGSDADELEFEKRIHSNDSVFFHKKLHEICPEPYYPNNLGVVDFIKNILSLPFIDAQQLDSQYRMFSQYMHANPISVSGIEKDESDGRHVLRCAEAIRQTGVVVVGLTYRLIEVGRDDWGDLDSLNDYLHADIRRLWEMKKTVKGK